MADRLRVRATAPGGTEDDSSERETQAGAECAAHDLIAPRAERTSDGGLTSGAG